MDTKTLLRYLAKEIAASDKFLARDLLINGELVRGRLQLQQDQQSNGQDNTGINQQLWLLSVPEASWPLDSTPQAQSKLNIDEIGYRVIEVLGTDPNINVLIMRNF